MPGRILRRLAMLRAKLTTEADALPGDVVRAIWGGPLGFVESVSGTHATVFWHTRVGHREIIDIKNIRRASADPAFGPDVREGQP